MADRSAVLTNSNTREARPIGDIVQDIVRDFQEVIRGEIRLARAEVTANVDRAKNAGVMFGAAAITGLMAAGALVATCIAALALAMPVWLAALITTFFFGCVAGAALAMGRERLRKVDALPKQTMDSLKDDVEWAKHQMR